MFFANLFDKLFLAESGKKGRKEGRMKSTSFVVPPPPVPSHPAHAQQRPTNSSGLMSKDAGNGGGGTFPPFSAEGAMSGAKEAIGRKISHYQVSMEGKERPL